MGYILCVPQTGDEVKKTTAVNDTRKRFKLQPNDLVGQSYMLHELGFLVYYSMTIPPRISFVCVWGVFSVGIACQWWTAGLQLNISHDIQHSQG